MAHRVIRRLRLRPRVKRALLVLLSLLLLATPAGADDDWDRAMALMKEGQYAQALPFLERVRERHGEVTLVNVMYATCLNRLGNYEAAWKVVDSTLSTDPDHPLLNLEAGVAAHHLGRHEAAVMRLSRALELGIAQEGEARALLGASLAAQGDATRAREELTRAEALLDRDSPAYRTARDWRRQLERMVLTPEDRRWSATISLGLGHASNAVQLGEDALLPGGVSNRSSIYGTLRGFLWADLLRTDRSRLRVLYTPDVRWYDRARSVGYMSHPLEVEWTHDPSEKWRLEGRLRWQNDWLLSPARKYRYVVEPSAVVAHHWSSRTSTRLSFAVSLQRFQLGGFSNITDPSGLRYRVGLEQPIFADEAGKVAIYPSIGYTWSDTRGRDWDSRAVDAGLAALIRPNDRLSITLGIYTAWYSYANRHSLTGFTRARRDTIVVPYAQLTYRVTPWFGFTASVSRTGSASNISAFRYSNVDVSFLPFLDVYEIVRKKEGNGQ